jgi:uncharacterized protein (DUF697 family)
MHIYLSQYINAKGMNNLFGFGGSSGTNLPKYKPDEVAKLAKKYFDRAKSIVTTYVILGILIGAVTGLGILRNLPAIGLISGGAIGALLGYSTGETFAMDYRWKAHTLLTQLQVELNTRPKNQSTQIRNTQA